MLAETRDILATFFLEKQLGILRERYLAESLAGDPPGDEFFATGEADIREKFRRNFYNEQIRRLFKPGDNGQTGDEEDFAGRTQLALEQAIWFTHRRLAEIPYAGHEQYRDE